MPKPFDNTSTHVDAGKSESMSFANQFLIAMPNMQDSNFAGALVYVCEHTPEGALGVVVNRPTDLALHELFEKIEMSLHNSQLRDEPVMFGGPVQTDRGFVLHSPVAQFNSTLKVTEDIGLTTSKDVLQAMSDGIGPPRVLVTLGYAGWGPGQLEAEITQNAWLTSDASADIIFTLPHEQRLTAALKLLGVDPLMLSAGAGHA